MKPSAEEMHLFTWRMYKESVQHWQPDFLWTNVVKSAYTAIFQHQQNTDNISHTFRLTGLVSSSWSFSSSTAALCLDLSVSSKLLWHLSAAGGSGETNSWDKEPNEASPPALTSNPTPHGLLTPDRAILCQRAIRKLSEWPSGIISFHR